MKNKGKTCSVDGCDIPAYCRGMCHMHYKRDRRTGTTESREAKQVMILCATCGEEMYKMPSRGFRKYCSRDCWNSRPVKTSEATRAKRSRSMKRQDRKGKRNPNYRNGDHMGRDRDGLRRFQSGQEACQGNDCPGGGMTLNQHHVVYQQHVKKEKGDLWDGYNALTLCVSCHTKHHRQVHPLPQSQLRDENIEFAFELMGSKAFHYFERYYRSEETDPRIIEAYERSKA